MSAQDIHKAINLLDEWPIKREQFDTEASFLAVNNFREDAVNALLRMLSDNLVSAGEPSWTK